MTLSFVIWLVLLKVQQMNYADVLSRIYLKMLQRGMNIRMPKFQIRIKKSLCSFLFKSPSSWKQISFIHFCLYPIFIVFVCSNSIQRNQRIHINTYPHKQSAYLVIYVMIITVTSINLILTHQIFVGMTLKTGK